MDTLVELPDQTKTNASTAGKKSAKPSRLAAAITQDHINAHTPMGATLTADGATFRVWAPNKAIAVHLHVSEALSSNQSWTPSEATQLMRREDDTWTGFLSGVRDGDLYRFYLAGRGEQAYKRDPYARELEFYGYPDCDCVVRDSQSYPWHDQNHLTPAFNDLVIYQLHIGRYYALNNDGSDARQQRVGKFLDIIGRIAYLKKLGINAIEPLPIVEFQGPYSLGYNGTDIFSPEMDYGVEAADLPPYLNQINALLAEKGFTPLTSQQLEGQINQLKAMIDLCHLHGIAVILDVVYNHAGGFGDDQQSIYFFDRAFTGNNNDSQYFSDRGHAGGLVFAYWKQEVRQFLIDNAALFLQEYHVDGFRYDQVTVIDDEGGSNGWRFLQDLTNTLRFINPRAIHIAEYWRDDPSWILRETEHGGAGFDAVWHAGMRNTVRKVLQQAQQGQEAALSLNALRDTLYRPAHFSAAWRAVQHLENHDLQRQENSNDRQPRLAALADPSSARSWYARSRARVANGLLLTAPGIPLLFMGQEFIEDKYWSDGPDSNAFIWWDGLKTDAHMRNHLRFMQDLLQVRQQHPALRAENIHVFYVHEQDRIIAWHRWLADQGQDVVIIASLNENTFEHYQLGMPQGGLWREIFNSDVYDHYPNPQVAGNKGCIVADSIPQHGLGYSARLVIPANALLIFSR